MHTPTPTHALVLNLPGDFFHSPAEQSDKNSALIKQEMLALQAMLNTLDYKRKVSDIFCHPCCGSSAFSPYSHVEYSNAYVRLLEFSSQKHRQRAYELQMHQRLSEGDFD